MGDRIINTSGKDRWMTPPAVLDWVEANVGTIVLDAAADAGTVIHRCGAPVPFLTDALAGPWPDFGTGVVWCNPPYSRAAGGLAKWCKAMKENGRRMTVVGLFFARTETEAWHESVSEASEVYFLRGRLRFIDPRTGERGGSAPAPSVLVVWRPCRWSTTYANLDLRRELRDPHRLPGSVNGGEG